MLRVPLRYKPVHENQIRSNSSSSAREQLFTVSLLRFCGHGGGSRRYDVNHIGMRCQNRGQRSNYVLDLFGDSTEREQDGLSLRAEAVFEEIGIHKLEVGDAVRNDVDLASWN